MSQLLQTYDMSCNPKNRLFSLVIQVDLAFLKCQIKYVLVQFSNFILTSRICKHLLKMIGKLVLVLWMIRIWIQNTEMEIVSRFQLMMYYAVRATACSSSPLFLIAVMLLITTFHLENKCWHLNFFSLLICLDSELICITPALPSFYKWSVFCASCIIFQTNETLKVPSLSMPTSRKNSRSLSGVWSFSGGTISKRICTKKSHIGQNTSTSNARVQVNVCFRSSFLHIVW